MNKLELVIVSVDITAETGSNRLESVFQPESADSAVDSATPRIHTPLNDLPYSRA